MQNIRAEVVLASGDLAGDIAFFTKRLGMPMQEIFPADDPRVAVFAGYGLRVRLEAGEGAPGRLRLLGDEPELIAGGEMALTSPGGTRVEIAPLAPPVVMPEVQQEFRVRRLADDAPWVVGRAGMEYRDLIPTRLGGGIIASHIRIPGGGPVPDVVHYHSVGFQLIFCIRGWVDLVYEGQGEPFRLKAGNCVIQPPEIRHRVLFASPDIEVIEVGVPAEHLTTIDHTMTLPTPEVTPERRFEGQRFLHHRAEGAEWVPHGSGLVARDTGVAEASGGAASVQVLRRGEAEPLWHAHDAEIHFGYVMRGRMVLEAEGQAPALLGEGDAFVTPRGVRLRYAESDAELELLDVTLPADGPALPR